MELLRLNRHLLLLPVIVADLRHALAAAEAAAERVGRAGVVIYWWVRDSEWAEHPIAVMRHQVIWVAFLAPAAQEDRL